MCEFLQIKAKQKWGRAWITDLPDVAEYIKAPQTAWKQDFSLVSREALRVAEYSTAPV